MRLVIVGIKGPETVRLEALRRELGLDESVEFTGWVTRERLYRFFRDAVAFVYPSRFEGFGIPVLEALSAGIPTACSSIPSLLEIASGSARFFEPDDIADMAAAMAEITDDAKLRETLIAAGKQRSVAFTWAQSAKSLLASLNRTASSR
jgi:glycosyltransferase involved in cell wall biosynthesis